MKMRTMIRRGQCTADEVTTSGDGGTNAAVGDDTLETERSDSQPSQAGPYLTGSAQKY